MGASPAFSGDRALQVVAGTHTDFKGAPRAVRTEAHAMGAGVGLRSIRRRIPPEAGYALEILGHAIEYLADEYAYELGGMPRTGEGSPEPGADPRVDPRVQAIQVLMAANREIYYACPAASPLHRRLLARLFSR